MTTRHCLLPLLALFAVSPLCSADPLKETEFTYTDAIRLLNGKGWSFSYAPVKPVRRLDVLIYEERTDAAGKTTTTVRHACMLGMLPRERVFPIKLLLVGNDLHTSIDAAGSAIKVSDAFVSGAAEYRKDGECVEDNNGRRFLLEIGNKKEFKGKPPFTIELKFKIHENLDQAELKRLLEGEPAPDNAKVEEGGTPKA